MKKLIKSAVTLALALAIAGSSLTATAEAAVKKSVHCIYNTGKTCTFVDKNKNGICDNCDGKKNGKFIDKNKDGICDNHTKHNPNCTNNRKKVNKNVSGSHHSKGHGHGKHHN